ncbi:ribosomal-processing cysteine protease Prp [Atopobacter phocae]|uniref:ribosomal-processing cysteine protease Prp n=1 Tax=Atopobacter phocae TaxID=136492 RepID=UPI00046F51EB|nr:ribosomal-processing cysteine protease Prp [Atopobacter phocae]
MIKFTIFQNSEGHYEGITVTGHAGFGQYGEDIVCSAISALVIGSANTLTELLKAPVSITVDEIEGGFLKIEGLLDIQSPEIFEKSQFLMQHLHLSVQGIEESYRSYIQMIIKHK